MSHAVTIALGIVVKATLVLGVAGVIAAVLARASAAARHLVWLLALGGLVAVAALTPVAPQLRVAVPMPAHRQDVATASPPQSLGVPVIDNITTRPSAGGARVLTSSAVRSTTIPVFGADQILPLLAMVWMIGCVMVIVRCIVAHIAVGGFVRASEPVSGADWQRLVREAAATSRVRRRVVVALSDAVGGPITSGFRRPVILLPRDAETWTDERREVVLLHEMAHVARFDYVAQLVATTACSVFWFHPAAWIAAARMRLEAEHAADDRVLAAGLPEVGYATHLVELARRAAIGEPAAVAVGIAHPHHIERRIRAMLDVTRSRAEVSARKQWFAVAVTLVMLIPLAGVRTEAAAVVSREPAATARPIATVAAVVVRPTAPVTRKAANVARTAPRVASEPVGVATQGGSADSTFERTLDAAPGGRIAFDLNSGGEIVIHGWDQPRARVRVRLSGPDWRNTRVDLGTVSGGIEVRSDFERERNYTQTDHLFELWVPRRSDIELSSRGGSVSIEDVEGEFRGRTSGGAITIRRAKGRSSLSTGGGDITVSESDLSGTVSTGGGSVLLSTVAGGLRGSSGSGPIVYADRADGLGDRKRTADLSGMTITSDRITTSGRAVTTTTSPNIAIGSNSDIGALHISKAGGAIRLDNAPTGGTIHTGGGNIVIGSVGGNARVSTGGGDIEIRRITGSATVSTGAGEVRLTVVDEAGREHMIEASSGFGTIEVVLPKSFDGRLDLEAAYTDGFGRRSQIESDWTLERSESAEWERSPYSGDTRRKFVRAQGAVGSGRSFVRVKTVNGDVIVRRDAR